MRARSSGEFLRDTVGAASFARSCLRAAIVILGTSRTDKFSSYYITSMVVGDGGNDGWQANRLADVVDKP